MQINFFVGYFLKLFQRIQNQYQILRFFDTYIEIIWGRNCRDVILALFAKFEAKRAQKAKKN
jgi:hypothetical protein